MSAVRVKPLEWVEHWSGYNEDLPCWRGKNPLGLMVSVDFIGTLRLEKHADAPAEELAAKKAAAQADYEARILSVLLPAQTEPDAGRVEAEAKVAELEAQVKRLNRIATDRQYMLNAYRAMLGPNALKVAEAWDKKGVVRQHTYWGPEAHSLTGEERAQVLLDVDASISKEVSSIDIDLPQENFLSTPPSPSREEIEHQGVVAVGVKG